MISSSEKFWSAFVAHAPRTPRTRLEKKRASRYRRSARQQLVMLAGHARRNAIGPIAWAHITGTVGTWQLSDPVAVPRVLQSRFGKDLGAWRAYRQVLGQAHATWAAYAGGARAVPT